jgi:hypothetical protein
MRWSRVSRAGAGVTTAEGLGDLGGGDAVEVGERLAEGVQLRGLESGAAEGCAGEVGHDDGGAVVVLGVPDGLGGQRPAAAGEQGEGLPFALGPVPVVHAGEFEAEVAAVEV